MRSPKATPEDPNIVAAREREQARAEAARTEETQALLLGDTVRRLRRFGRLPGRGNASGGSVPIYGAPSVPGGGGSVGGGTVFGGGTGGGGGGRGGGGGPVQMEVLY